MSSLLYVLNIGTLATWLTVAGASTVAAVVHVSERLPLLEDGRQEETELSVTPLAMGSAPPAEAAADEAPAEPQEAEPTALAELPETPEMPALPDLSELEPLPEIPEMPVAPAPAEVRREAAPKVAVRAAVASSPSQRSTGQRQVASAASGRANGGGSGQGNSSARGAGSSAVGSDRWVGGRMPKPNYPSAARRSGQQGRVVVQFTVDERGYVVDAKITGSCPHSVLNEEALRTVRRWKFRPGPRASASRPIVFQLN